MRRPLIAGNWKMNLNRAAAVELASAIAQGSRRIDWADIAIFPPNVYIDVVRGELTNSQVAHGAQNVSDQPDGALTGETSAAMLVDLGCRYVILGHSERRHILGETDELVHRKVKAALAAGLLPVVCLGEQLADREAGRTGDVIRTQFEGSLAGLTEEQIGRLVVAYEPVWAIGTGKVATPAQAQAVHMDLRKILKERYNEATAQAMRILYGGSVKANNAAELLAQSDVDGALVGGACLKADEFLAIASAAKRL